MVGNIPKAASHPNTGGITHFLAFNSTPKCLGKTLGIFSVKPPPVIWAKALTCPVRIAFKTGLT